MHDVLDELRRAVDTHGDMASPHEGYAVILEELDELWDEIKNNKNDTTAAQYREAMQVGAMAIRFMCTFGDGREGYGRSTPADSVP
jgi:hypothetical protein